MHTNPRCCPAGNPKTRPQNLGRGSSQSTLPTANPGPKGDTAQDPPPHRRVRAVGDPRLLHRVQERNWGTLRPPFSTSQRGLKPLRAPSSLIKQSQTPSVPLFPSQRDQIPSDPLLSPRKIPQDLLFHSQKCPKTPLYSLIFRLYRSKTDPGCHQTLLFTPQNLSHPFQASLAPRKEPPDPF